jgi:hypothetical protein
MGRSRTKSHQGNGKNWLASIKTTNAIAIGALAVSLIALVVSVYPHIEAHFAPRPEAYLVAPNPSTYTVPAGFLVTVRSNNIPDSSDLWFIVRAGSQDEWYPYYLMIPNETWSMTDVCPAVGKQTLQVWLVPDSEDAALLTYINNTHRTYTQGLTNMGSYSRVLAFLNVDVTKKCPG